MEQTSAEDWSGFDSKDRDKRKSFELPKPVAPEAVPERPKPAFDLGIIFDRKDVPPETLQVVSQEHDHVKPEFVQGVTPGTPELAEYRASVPSPAQAAHMESVRAQADQNVEQDGEEDEDEEENTSAPRVTQPTAPPPEQVEPEEVSQVEPIFQFPETPLVPDEQEQPVVPQAAETVVVPPDELEPDQYNPPQPQQPPAQTPLPTPAGGGGNRQPPPPPINPGNTYPGPQGGPQYNAPMQWNTPPPPSRNAYFNMFPPTPSPNQLTRAAFEASQDQLRRQRIARTLLLLLLTWYLARRPIKPLRQQVKQMEQTAAQQDERISHLTYEQQAAQRRIAEQQRQIEQFTKPQQQAVPFEKQAAAAFTASQIQEAKEAGVVLPVIASVPSSPNHTAGLGAQEAVSQPQPQSFMQPEQRTELVAGATVPGATYRSVVNELGQVVPVVFPGEAYRQDVAQEQGQNTAQQNRRDRSFAGGGGGYSPASPTSGQASTSGEFMPNYYSLPANADQLRQQPQYQLNIKKRNPVLAALASPWLWLAVGVVMVAFFLAATI